MRKLLGVLVVVAGLATATGVSVTRTALPAHADGPLPVAVPSITDDPGRTCADDILTVNGVPNETNPCLPGFQPK